MQKRPNSSSFILTASFIWIFSIILQACGAGDAPLESQDQTDNSTGDITCDSLQPQFNDDIWPVLQSDCFACHEQNNVAGDFSLLGENFSNYREINFSTFRQVSAKSDSFGVSLMLSKSADMNNDHGGGQNFPVTSGQYKKFEDIIFSLQTCTDNASTNSGLVLDTGYSRLRKTTFALAGRLPTTAEERQITDASKTPAQTAIAYGAIIDRLMTEEYFYERLKTIFNDLVLLDAFPGDKSLAKFELNNFVNNNYFDSASLGTYYDSATIKTIRNNAGYGLAMAPLELVAHVVRENRPFTEILTADYLLVNPYSATIFSADVGDPAFNFIYGDDPAVIDTSDFREARITATENVNNGEIVFGDVIPQAGILSSHTFLRRYPSTNTNVNRARSRYVFKYFLDIDIEGLASRDSLNLDKVIGNYPTLEDPQCKACHDTMDPVAGLFKNRRNKGRYRGDFTGWLSDQDIPKMLKPGVGINIADQLPSTNSANALQWLAGRIVSNPGFSRSVVKTVFKGFTGQDISQDIIFFERLRMIFEGTGYDLKALVKAVISSDYFLASNLKSTAKTKDYPEYGMSRLLTPEQLHQKVLLLTGGYHWSAPKTGRDLLDADTYRTMYGGIDSVGIITRTTQPTSIMVGIQERIANQTACEAVPADFNLPANRVFFPFVEVGDTPGSASGKSRIKQNLVYLHKYLLGEKLTVSDPEITRSYDLFVKVRDLTVGSNVPEDCAADLDVANPVRIDAERTVRPWMAVIAYLLSDYRFLYE